MRGIPNKESASGGFLKAGTLARSIGGNASHRSFAQKREGGIKLLEISEQPLGGREAKRRRRQQGLNELYMYIHVRHDQQLLVRVGHVSFNVLLYLS